MPTRLAVPAHRAVEWTLTAAIPRPDPWGGIQLHAELQGPGGATLRVPAYWDGGDTWRLRLGAAEPGIWRARSVCSDPGDAGLHGQEAELVVGPAVAGSRFDRHGAVGIAGDGTHFAHADGTPFPWLGDTWWMLMSERVAWPDGFARLVAHRAGQGFTVAQVVVGFPPDTTPFDGRDGNAGGSPWEPGYARINPAYFQACDRRLAAMIAAGILPCILGGWGYHLLFMGEERALAHWRYLVARYAAWPVAWCLAGEGGMPFYLSQDPPGDSQRLQAAWPALARAVRAEDPWRRPLSLHPRRNSWDDTTDPATLDFHMLQPGHLPNALRNGVESLAIGRDRFPDRIIVNAEPPYEGHGGTNGPDIQRHAFWSTVLSGGMGFTYGAAGIFQANDRERPTGNRPDGGAFDAVFWDDAMRLPGAAQIAAGHGLLSSLPFHRFRPHPEWVEACLRWGAEVYNPPWRAYAAGIPGECRIIYLPLRWYHWEGPLVRQLEPGLRYRAVYVEPDSLRRHPCGIAAAGPDGCWRAPTLPHLFDWLLLLERER